MSGEAAFPFFPAGASRERPGPIRYVKVFGERNTGTTFLNKLIELNARGVVMLTHDDNDEVRAGRMRYSPGVRRVVANRIADELRRREFPENFGWKHAVIAPDYLARSPRFPETLFVCIVRDPYYWAGAIFRQSYNFYIPPPKVRETFLTERVFPNMRDNVDRGFLDSPIDYWNLKVGSYLACAGLPNLRIVRYEDVIADPRGFVAALAGLGLTVRDDVALVERAAKKKDVATFEDYVAKARAFDPHAVFSRAEIEAINAALDPGLCATFGYPVADPAAARGTTVSKAEPGLLDRLRARLGLSAAG
jgi:hypothetical protein